LPLLQCRGLSGICFCRLCVLNDGVESCSPVPGVHKHPAHSAVCPLQFLVYHSVFFGGVFFFFLQCWGQSVQEPMLVSPRGGCGNTACHLFAHLVVGVSQAGLEPSSGSTGALLFSQCNVAWRSFVPAGGSGRQEFCFFLVVFSC
jgi:hypothetical protein